MRKALTSLLVFAITFALVARGVAAPLMHLHPEMPIPTAPPNAAHHEHNHADCAGAERSDVAGTEDVITVQTHGSPAQDTGTPLGHDKFCDSNGACCGPLVLSDASDVSPALAALPEPSRITASAGVKPLNPDRPPSPSIA